MTYESLSHKGKKGSTAKWFVIAIIPILNLYWLWKTAEVVSGHEKAVVKKHEVIEHMDEKESTGEWFCTFLLPFFLGIFAALAVSSSEIISLLLGIAAFILVIYVLYKMAVGVSGHETWYPERDKAVKHKEKRDSTVKWLVIAIIPILNLYFLWKMSETISGHETVCK